MSSPLQKQLSRPLLAGLRFGMLLQLAVGPVCLYIFRLGADNGVSAALLGVSAVILIDTLYIFLAGLGISTLLRERKIQAVLGLLGAVIVCFFGANILFGAFGRSLLPAIRLFGGLHSKGSFVDVLLLTASNPLTILFWSGVFSSKIAEGEMNQRETCLFGVGCVLATLLFLSLVAFLGSIVGNYLPSAAVGCLNGLVGVALILFGLKQLFKIKKRGTV